VKKKDLKYIFNDIYLANADSFIKFDLMKIEKDIFKLEGRISNLESSIQTWAEVNNNGEIKRYPFIINIR